MTTPNKDNITACPTCGADLNALMSIKLYAVTVQTDGTVTDYDGGPQPDSEQDLIDLCNEGNSPIVCDNGHLLNGTDVDQSDPFLVLERISRWPANSNSEPDIMGQALDQIQILASRAAQILRASRR